MAEQSKACDLASGKVCSNCGERKDLGEFSKRASARDGLSPFCKECASVKNAEWRKKNDGYHKQHGKEYYLKKRDSLLSDKKEYYLENKEVIKEKRRQYYGTEKARLARKSYYERNKERILAYNSEKRRQRLQNSVSCKIAHATRARIGQCIKGGEKGKISRMDWTMPELIAHLERQFTKKMTWDNYGRYWHIDHILPVSSFDHTDEGQFMACWSLANLRPLEAKANISKGAKVLTLL